VLVMRPATKPQILDRRRAANRPGGRDRALKIDARRSVAPLTTYKSRAPPCNRRTTTETRGLDRAAARRAPPGAPADPTSNHARVSPIPKAPPRAAHSRVRPTNNGPSSCLHNTRFRTPHSSDHGHFQPQNALRLNRTAIAPTTEISRHHAQTVQPLTATLALPHLRPSSKYDHATSRGTQISRTIS
jgi:hypothetical protein